MEAIYIIIVMIVFLDNSDGISHRGSPVNVPNYKGGIKIIYKRRIRDAEQFSRNQTFSMIHPKNKTDFISALSKQHKMHISDFTNPKTGLNPFLDLQEGTSNSTSRNKNLTSGGKHLIIHVIPPPKSKANKQSETKQNAWNVKPASSKSQTIFNKAPLIKDDWLILEPVEGDSGGRIGRPQHPGRSSSRETSHVQDVTVHRHRGMQRNSKAAIWNDIAKKQHSVPNVHNQTTTVTTNSPNTNSISTLITEGTGTIPIHSFSTKAPVVVVKSNRNPIKNNHEQIYSINTNHKIIIISIVSGVTVVFLIILLTMCFCKERSNRFTDSRCIALENINANSIKKTTEHNYNLVREYKAVEDKMVK